MRGYVQVLGGGTLDGGRSILLFLDERRYLFTCSPGTQRFCTQHHIRLRLTAMFLPHLQWSVSGGLPGLIFTLADSAGGRLRLVGPRGTGHFVGSLRAFLRRSAFQLTIHEAEDDEVAYTDGFITVRTIELFDRINSEACKRLKTPPPPSSPSRGAVDVENLHVEERLPNEFVLKMFKDPNHFEKDEDEKPARNHDHHDHHLRDNSRMPSFTQRESTICYIVEGRPTPGKFDAITAKRLGVPVGPLNGRLMKGESVTLSDGSVVEPSQCVGPSIPGSVFALLEVRTMEQLHDLALKLERFKDNPSLSLIIYICPIHIYEGEEFREIQSAFPSTVHQAWINDGNNQLVYSSGAEVLATLNKIVHNDIFPVPFHETNEGPGIRALTKFHISGKNPVLLNTEDADLNVTNSNSTLSVTSTYNPSPKNPAITFLGTGAALPGKYRNVSATLVDFGDAAYLFDCGEGTAGQLWRRFGPQNCPRILQRLEGVLLSHLHADHHLGLPDVLGMVGKRLNIVAPERYKVFLTELGECADLLNSHDTFHSERLYEEADYQEEVSTILKLGKIVTVPVIHCPRSFGFVLHHKSGTRIVYSGDTRPCPALIESGRGSDILIHEATFADSLTTEAIERRHCTISEAITVGQSMQVSFTLLTHISQRHSKSLPPYDWNIVDRVLPVMDFMTVSLDQLKSMNFKELISSMLTNLPSDNDDQVQEDDQGNRHE